MITFNLAKHFREVFFGGNWTVSNLKDQLAEVTWEEAIADQHDKNTIATLTFHIGYFVAVTLRVLEGGPLEGNDKLSFDHPPITCEEDWQNMVNQILANAEAMAKLIEALPDEKLWEDFTNPKYGSYYRNIAGIIEHTHYHLGQIVVLKGVRRKA